MVLRPLILLLALVVSGEELVGGEPQVFPLSTEEWSPDPRQIIYHGGQGLGGGEPEKGNDLNP